MKKSQTVLLCALLLTSMILVVSAPVESEEEFPELPPRPFAESPDIESYGVSPATGWNDTTFSFHLNASFDYFWNETIPRLDETIRVYIDNIPYAMNENNTRDTNWSDGKHWFWMNEERLWSKGFHDYFFYIEINESSNMTDSGQFEIYNRAPYMLEGPFGKIYTTQEFEFEFRATDEDMDPLTWTLTTNMTEDDYDEFETEELNTSFKLKIKCENGDWVRWFKIVVYDPFDNEAYWRWEVYCLENEIPGRNPSVPRHTGGGSDFTRGVGDSQITPNDGPLHNTDFYWCGSNCGGDEYQWDDQNNWRDGATWTVNGYPQDNGDRAFFNETADDLYLVHGVNSLVTIGELKLSAGFTGSVTMSIDLIIDHVAAHNGHMEVSSGTWDVNTSNEQINLDGFLYLLDTGTFVERAGIVVAQGSAVVQRIRVQDTNELYRFVVDSPVTTADLYDNLTAFQITVGTGTTYRCDANTRGYELWTNYTDASGCGFVATSAGTLNLIGTATYQCNITTADAAPPPTNYWALMPSSGNNLAYDFQYANLSYFDRTYARGGTVDIENTTFYYNRVATAFTFFAAVTINAFNNNTFTDTVSALGTLKDYDGFKNIVISARSGTEVQAANKRMEFLDSNFDATSVDTFTTGDVISNNHNDVADDYKIWATDFLKSAITNDFTTGDNIELVSGTFIVDEAAAAKTIDINAGTFQIGKDVPTASRTLTFDDAVGAGFDINSAGTLQAIGDEANNYLMEITSAATPPANYWSGNMGTGDPDIHLENATLEYGRYLTSGGTWTIDNATIDNFRNDAFSINVQLGGTIAEFNDATISNSAQGLLSYVAHANFDNTVIDSMTVDDIQAEDIKLEFTNSNFDPGQVDLATSGNVVSHTHNDSANEVHIMATDLDKSAIVNDYASGDFVRLYTGTLTIEEASASDDMLIDAGATLILNIGETQTFDTLANFTVNGIAKLNGEMTASSGYFDFYTPGMSWLNGSDITSADLCQYYGGFNFSIGIGFNSTLNNYTANMGANNMPLNITSETYLAKDSGIVWHMNATVGAMAFEVVEFDFGNLTTGASYRLYNNGVLVGTRTADANGMVFFVTTIDDTPDHLNLTYYAAAVPAPPGPGPGQYDRWIVGFEYSKNFFTNEVKFHAVFNYDHNASWYIWDFDGQIYESASPNLTRNFAFAFYSSEDVKLTIIATDGNRYWMESPIILDNTLWIALLILTVISLAAIAIIHTRKARRKTELIMVESEGR